MSTIFKKSPKFRSNSCQGFYRENYDAPVNSFCIYLRLVVILRVTVLQCQYCSRIRETFLCYGLRNTGVPPRLATPQQQLEKQLGKNVVVEVLGFPVIINIRREVTQRIGVGKTIACFQLIRCKDQNTEIQAINQLYVAFLLITMWE